MKTVEMTLGEALAIILLCLAIIFALTCFHLWLWGVIAVKIFGLPALNFWQFVGLKILARSLFGSAMSLPYRFAIREEEK